MGKNRIRNGQSLHWMVVVKWVFIVAIVASLGLAYILCKNQIVCLAEEARRQEKQLVSINERNKQLTLDIARLKSPQALQRRMENRQLVRLSQLELVRMDQGALPNLARTYNPAMERP
jgi:hypothetical protein